MTKEEILRIKTHIRIHAARERGAVIITDILKKAVNELEHTADIEKENAELKLKLKALDEQTPWKDIKEKSELIRALTKAKEIIKDLLGSENTSCEEEMFFEIRQKAEQFLKDSINETVTQANEWHYVKDGDLPKEDSRPRTFGYYLTASKYPIYKGLIFEVAYFTGTIFTRNGRIYDNVVAWKEIVLPEVKEIKEND